VSSENAGQDPRAEYAALVRGLRAHLELEHSFGIDRWDLPPPPPAVQPAAPGRPAARADRPNPYAQYAQRREANDAPDKPPRPAAKPAPKPQAEPEPVMHVTTQSSVGLFSAKDYAIDIPDGLPKGEQLDCFAAQIADCTVCPLHKGRTQVVFGAGDPDADLMFIGEAPGRDEDAQGIPFVGRAGQLLTKIIQAIEFTRDQVYIANISKCRPPNNRAPTPDEMDKCLPFLERQIEIIEPRVLCLLGATAVRGLLKVKQGITKLRGRFIEWRGIYVMPTYHPAYLLRNPAGKRDVWEDVQKVRDKVRGLS
jgi:DNA polymerase